MIQIGDKSYYTVEDVREKTGLHPKTIRTLLKDGRLKGKKIGRAWYVPETSLQNYFEGRDSGA